MGSEELLLEAGKSAELAAALQTLMETECEGEAKYSPTTCREVAKLLVCRTYATILPELVHLCTAARELGPIKGQYEYFFWDSGPARAARFKSYAHQYFASATDSYVTDIKNTIELGYPDGSFHVHYSRVPVLCAFLEFLLTAVGYPDIDALLQGYFSAGPSLKNAHQCANKLAKSVYGYLSNHLPTAQSQRKFRHALAFCQDDVERIDDDHILSFWQEKSLDDDKTVDFKTFASALQTNLNLVRAVETARDLPALTHARSIGYDTEQGEINPDHLHACLDHIDEATSPLDQLSTPPCDAIKFLNKQEHSQSEAVLKFNGYLNRFKRSYLRDQSFALCQGRLTQALRNKADQTTLTDIISAGPDTSYNDQRQKLDQLSHHLTRVLSANLHALFALNCETALDLLPDLFPDLDHQDLQNALPAAINSTELAGADNLIAIIQNAPAFLPIREAAQNAYKSLSRKGFKGTPDPVLKPAFNTASPALLEINKQVATLQASLPSPSHLNEDYLDDCAVFQRQYHAIYVTEDLS